MLTNRNGVSASKQRFIVMFLLLIAVMVFLGMKMIGMAEQRVKESLQHDMGWLQAACQEEEGCFALPENWKEQDCASFSELVQGMPAGVICASPPEEGAYRGLVYAATEDYFIARWRYVSDVELIVRGGKGRTLSVEELKI